MIIKNLQPISVGVCGSCLRVALVANWNFKRSPVARLANTHEDRSEVHFNSLNE